MMLRIFFVTLAVLFCSYLLIFSKIKRLITKHKVMRQQKDLQSLTTTPLQLVQNPDIEMIHTAAALIASGGFFLHAFVIFLFNGSSQSAINDFLTATIVFALFELCTYCYRLKKGHIQGAVLFDPKEKKIYAFPSADSENYRVYAKSDLCYTTQRYLHYPFPGKKGFKDSHIFFTKKERYFAFSSAIQEENGFGEMLSQIAPIEDKDVPLKYSFYSIKPLLIGFIIFIVSAFIPMP